MYALCTLLTRIEAKRAIMEQTKAEGLDGLEDVFKFFPSPSRKPLLRVRAVAKKWSKFNFDGYFVVFALENIVCPVFA